MGVNRVTSSDVAAASGVSQATVSYVINNTPGQTISDATRARVLRAADELGYVPSFAGRTLRRGHTKNILLDMSQTPQGFEIFVNKFSDILHEHGYRVAVIHATGGARNSLEDLAQALSPIVVIQFAQPTAAQVSFLRRVGVQQIAWADFEPMQTSAQQLWALAGVAQIDHLHATGRRSIAYLLPADPAFQKVGFERAAGASRRAKALGIRQFRVLDSPGDPGTLSALLKSAVLDTRKPIDAVACFNDEVAFQVLGTLHRLEIAVPDQVAVIGIGDIGIAPYAIPPLTTVRMPAEKFGVDSAARVLAVLGHDVEQVSPDDFTFSVAQRESA
jgi:DNA-binding LacI/PurR family transcriptional regulator